MRYEEHCRYWTRGISATYYEPGEPAGCTDPRHCAEHWTELVRHVPAKDLPEVECPVCHESKQISIGEYAFNDAKEELVAASGAMCEECEMAVVEA